MDSARELARAVAQVKTVTVQGRFYRFIARQRLARALHGSPNGGRWGPRGGFPVLYLTDTYDGCVIEAYRHIVEPSEQDATAPPVGLALVTCDVEVSNIVDLTTATGRFTVGITAEILFSEPQPETGAAYEACNEVARAAHQLGRHGILAPAATQAGSTLALFMDVLPGPQRPLQVGPVTYWDELPADPRRLRLVRDEET